MAVQSLVLQGFCPVNEKFSLATEIWPESRVNGGFMLGLSF